MSNCKCIFDNVDIVYSIGDIHGDFQTFKKILFDIGSDPLIAYDQIFSVYTKNIYGCAFELCRINKNNIKNDNFCIIQCGDLLYSAFKKVKTSDNEELRLLIFVLSLINSFNIISTVEKSYKSRYIQLLGNHDILILSSNSYSCLEDSLKKLNYFKTFYHHKKALWKLKNALYENGLIFCKINDILYTHCFFDSKSNEFLFQESQYFKSQNKKNFNYSDNRFKRLNSQKDSKNENITIYNIIIKCMISDYNELNLDVDSVKDIFIKDLRYFNKNLIDDKLDEYTIKQELNTYFGCNKVIMGHMYSPYYKEYLNGTIKIIDIGISQKIIQKYNLKRNFEIFYCCLCKNNICLVQK